MDGSTGVMAIFLAGLAVLAVLLAHVLGRLRLPGRSVLAGTAAGILLGPAVLGRLAPEWYEHHLIGGDNERGALWTARGEYDAAQLAAVALGVEPTNDPALANAFRAREAELEDAWKSAQWEHQRPLRLTALTVAGVLLLGSGLLRLDPGTRRSVAQKPGLADLVTPISIGAWSAALPGGLTYFSLSLMDYHWTQAAAAAAAIAVGPSMLTTVDRETADHAELGGSRLMQTSGRIATLLAGGLLVWLLLRGNGAVGLVYSIPVLAFVLGWLLPRSETPRVRFLLEGVLLAVLAALVAVKLELFEHIALLATLIIVILAGDGRWLGGYAGAMLIGGRKSLRTMRLVMASMGAGPSQLAFAAIALYAGVLPESLALALLLGTFVVEFGTPARRRVAIRLIEAEDDMERAQDELEID